MKKNLNRIYTFCINLKVVEILLLVIILLFSCIVYMLVGRKFFLTYPILISLVYLLVRTKISP